MLGVVCCDAGGAEIVSSWLKKNKKTFLVSAKGPAKKIFQKLYKNIEFEPLSKLLNNSKEIITGTGFTEFEVNAIERAKKTVAFYISVGKIYRDFLSNNGYKNDVKNIYDEYINSGLKNNFNLVTDRMVKDLCICGTPDEALHQLKEFQETGIDLPIIQFNPINEVESSFDLLIDTFGDSN